jgi:hypothetical protein
MRQASRRRKGNAAHGGRAEHSNIAAYVMGELRRGAMRELRGGTARGPQNGLNSRSTRNPLDVRSPDDLPRIKVVGAVMRGKAFPVAAGR